MYAFIALCVQPNLQFPVFIYISYMTYYSHLIFLWLASGTSFIYIYIYIYIYIKAALLSDWNPLWEMLIDFNYLSPPVFSNKVEAYES